MAATAHTGSFGADEPAVEPLMSLQYGTLVLKDVGYVLSAPLRWKATTWAWLGADTAAVVGTAAFLDRPVQKANQRNRNNAMNVIAHVFDPLGSECALAVPGGFYLAGMVWHNDTAKAVAQDSLAATLVEAGMITPSLKLAIGRHRPKDGDGAYRFTPFGGEGVFPSGHTGEAFTLASVVAEHYDAVWVKSAAYGVAGLVGFARIVDNAHYTSDVLAGALIGTAVGRAIVHFNKQQRLQVSPVVDGDTKGVKAVYSF